MENWSDTPVIEDFKVKFFLDTNIIVFLIDKTYSGLTKAIDILNKSEFVDLVSSKFVIFEFVGVRKKEHYLRLSIANPQVNISTLLKYSSNGFEVPEVDFDSIQPTIKANVEQELQDITNDFGIVYSDNLLHDDLLRPTFDICLASKISKEDSLVLTSSLLPEPNKPESEIHLLSKDEIFANSFHQIDLSEQLTYHSLSNPKVESITKIELNSGTKLNLTNNGDDDRIDEFIPSKIFEMINSKNNPLFIGKTFPPEGSDFPNDVLCFKLPLDKPLPNDIYVTIIAKNLSFIYTTKHMVSEFWQNGSPIADQYTTTNDTQTNISFRIQDDNQNTLPSNQMNRLREEGNAVYIHPDSIY